MILSFRKLLSTSKLLSIAGLTYLALTVSGCQNIQMAESPIPVTADLAPNSGLAVDSIPAW